MNKEIEELLNKAKDIAKYGADGKQHTRMFNQFEAKALLSYIEQLETKVKNLQNQVNTLKNNNEELKRRLKTVQQKRDTHKAVRYRLQNNRDKAIEYIENDLQISILPNNQIINGTEVVKRINKIEDILKGDSDENV